MPGASHSAPCLPAWAGMIVCCLTAPRPQPGLPAPQNAPSLPSPPKAHPPWPPSPPQSAPSLAAWAGISMVSAEDARVPLVAALCSVTEKPLTGPPTAARSALELATSSRRLARMPLPLWPAREGKAESVRLWAWVEEAGWGWKAEAAPPAARDRVGEKWRAGAGSAASGDRPASSARGRGSHAAASPPPPPTHTPTPHPPTHHPPTPPPTHRSHITHRKSGRSRCAC